MSTEIRPVTTDCNIRCVYCYQTSLRDADPTHRYDEEAVFEAAKKLDNPFSLFGGESLILPLPKIEKLLELCFSRWKSSGIQTNGTLITEAHIEAFKKYKTHVGISLDGPDELNDSRWAGTREATKKLTARTHWAIKRLAEESKKNKLDFLMPSIIVTLHAGNASKERFPRLVQWFHELDDMGIQHMNLHIMELDGMAKELYLPQEELADRLIDLWNMQHEFKNLRFTKFDEILRLLEGDDCSVVCIWRACDPHNTQAVNGIENDGAPSVCSRVHKGAINWLPAEGSGYDAKFIGHPGTRLHTRQLALYITPQEHGGCQGCPFWLVCLGNCPGEGEHGDWRLRSHYCYTFKRLFDEGAKRLRLVGKKPICDWEHRGHLEEQLQNLFLTGHPQATLNFVVKMDKDATKKGMTRVKNGYHADSDYHEDSDGK